MYPSCRGDYPACQTLCGCLKREVRARGSLVEDVSDHTVQEHMVHHAEGNLTVHTLGKREEGFEHFRRELFNAQDVIERQALEGVMSSGINGGHCKSSQVKFRLGQVPPDYITPPLSPPRWKRSRYSLRRRSVMDIR